MALVCKTTKEPIFTNNGRVDHFKRDGELYVFEISDAWLKLISQKSDWLTPSCVIQPYPLPVVAEPEPPKEPEPIEETQVAHRRGRK